MTESNLKKGQEIVDSIHNLKSKLASVDQLKWFGCDDGGPGCYGRQGDEFLSTLSIELRFTAVTKITGRIASLQKELEAL